MRIIRPTGGLPLLVWLTLQTGWAALTPELAAQLPPPAGGTISFVTDIQPLLEGSCVQCHGRGRAKGSFRMDTRETFLVGGDSGAAVVPGKSADSLLIELVSGLNPDSVMPAKGRRLTPREVGLLRAWIDQGVAWDSQVTFARPEPLNLKPRKPALDLKAEDPENPIDKILASYFKQNGITPPPVVEDRLFARRVYLDTLGLLPEKSELEAFLTDTRPEKREKLVKQLLQDNNAYAEHWLSFWNDLLRNDYRGTGYIDGGRKPITRWLFEALKSNLPYNRFVAELIDSRPESEGFVKGIVWRGVVNASQTPELQAAQNIAQVFMGVNLKCASCHDSFINDWKLSDAYGLASVFSHDPLQLYQCDKPTGQVAEPRFIYPELGAIDPAADRPARVKRLAEIITAPTDGRLPRTLVNRLWARLLGRGLVEPVDEMEHPAWNPDLLDWLAEDFVTNGYDIKHTIERILLSKAYQLPAVNLGESATTEFVFRGPAIRRLSAEQFRDALGQITGVWYEKADFPASTNRVRASLVASDPLMTSLGRPNREQVVSTRASTPTTLQALELTNGGTLAALLSRGAERLAEGAPSPETLVERLFLTANGRRPTPEEKNLAAEILRNPVQKEGMEDLLWAISVSPEFQLIY